MLEWYVCKEEYDGEYECPKCHMNFKEYVYGDEEIEDMNEFEEYCSRCGEKFKVVFTKKY